MRMISALRDEDDGPALAGEACWPKPRQRQENVVKGGDWGMEVSGAMCEPIRNVVCKEVVVVVAVKR